MDLEDEEIFSEDDFMLRSFDVFEDMRRKEQLVDFKINLEHRSVIGHRVVLAARIPHFRQIFCRAEAEGYVEEVYPAVLESVIDFAYSGKIKITPGNVVSLISVSKMLQLPQVFDACWEFLERRFSSNNVLQFRRLAEDHGCTTFLEAADNYIRQNFEEFSNSESFVDLSFQQFKQIISRDDIKFSTEEKVFEAVMRWVKSSECDRRDLLPELLRYVRMTPDYLTEQLSTEELVRSSLMCSDLVDEAKSCHALPGKRSRLCDLPSQQQFCKKKAVSYPLSSHPGHKNIHHLSTDIVPRRSLIYSVYGNIDVGINVKQLDPESERWLPVSKYDKSAFLDAVVTLGGVIYIFTMFFVYRFELSTKQWSSFHCQKDIFASGSVAYNGKIYFFGGGSSLNEAHCFDPRKDSFLQECRMTRALSWPGVALLRSSRGNSSTSETFIYVTGGYSGDYVYSKAERYNPETKEWSNVEPMFYKRYKHGCCNLKEKIYVCGGVAGTSNAFSLAEMFDPLANQWNVISSMTEATFSLSVASHEGKLYACGKRPPGSMPDGNIEIYDPKNDEWKIGAPIVERRRDHEIFLVKF